MDLPPSQASSHFDIEPIPASVLAQSEAKRRNALQALGSCKIGCPDIDDYVLMGGFERGCVVGLSTEEEDHVGLRLVLQTLVHALCDDSSQRALVITPKPANTILAVLRSVLKAELTARSTTAADVAGRMKDCLDRTLLSCVFDLDGLWEVLADLDKPESARQKSEPCSAHSPPRRSPVSEVEDSQDEEGFSPLPSENTKQPETEGSSSSSSSLPHMILITHFSTLLTGLFTQRDKAAAHSALQLLGSHLRYLSRHLASNPLIMLLNSTTTTADTPEAASGQRAPLDPTLRSVFDPPTLPYAHSSARRTKPSFGLVFAQLLDLHLLGTRVPRGKEDADAVYALGQRDHAATVQYVTLMEVLLDEMGLWEGRMGPRKSREQRWGAVCVRDGRVVDAFQRSQGQDRVYGEVRLAAGFGGPRV